MGCIGFFGLGFVVFSDKRQAKCPTAETCRYQGKPGEDEITVEIPQGMDGHAIFRPPIIRLLFNRYLGCTHCYVGRYDVVAGGDASQYYDYGTDLVQYHHPVTNGTISIKEILDIIYADCWNDFNHPFLDGNPSAYVDRCIHHGDSIRRIIPGSLTLAA